MTSRVSHRERMHSCLKGEQPDRPPVGLWRHFPADDQHPETLAAAALHFQNIYDFDFVKVTPASSFCLKDWGVEDRWEGGIEGTRKYTRRVVQSPADWERIKILPPSSKFLADQLACLRLLRRELGSETPILQTIFSPLAQAKNLAGGETLLSHLRQFPAAVMQGLYTITETTQQFIEAAIESGIDGVFYAIQHAQAETFSIAEYMEYGLPFDQKAIEPARSLWCNLLHLHGGNIHFSVITSLPFPIINWHDRETAPSLAEARRVFNGVLCGGLRQDTLVYGGLAEIHAQAHDALEQTQGIRFILGTGCVVPIIAPHGNILAARKSVEQL